MIFEAVKYEVFIIFRLSLFLRLDAFLPDPHSNIIKPGNLLLFDRFLHNNNMIFIIVAFIEEKLINKKQRYHSSSFRTLR